MALSRIHRLTKKKDFDTIFKEGSSLRESSLLARVQYHAHGPARFGIVVPAKIVKKATQRNRLRRILSETIQTLSRKPLSADVIILITRLPDEDVLREDLAHLYIKIYHAKIPPK